MGVKGSKPLKKVKWAVLLPVKRRACAYSTSDRSAHKKIDTCNVWGTYVPNLVKIGTQITSHSCPQTPDGRTDVYVILYSVQCICIALDRQ